MFTVQQPQPDGTTRTVEVPIEVEAAGAAAIDAFLATTNDTAAIASTKRQARGATSTKE